MFSLPFKLQKYLANLNILLETRIYFKYGKTKEGYFIGKHLLDRITIKTLSIIQVLYLGYKLLFIFDNTISHSIYAKFALQVAHMNKRLEG